LRGRYVEGRTSWDFGQEMRSLFRRAESMLDMATGGGEFLSSLGPLPERCTVTEGYGPNLRVARDRLAPLGVDVVDTFWDDNGQEPQRGALPFRTGTFDLVMDRHESFLPNEVARVLNGGGIFATQQVGNSNNSELREFFGKNPATSRRERVHWNLTKAVNEVESAGMKVLLKKEERFMSKFLDVGALTYYLKVIPWEVPGFSIRKDLARLRDADSTIRTKGSFTVTTSRFYLQARKQ